MFNRTIVLYKCKHGQPLSYEVRHSKKQKKKWKIKWSDSQWTHQLLPTISHFPRTDTQHFRRRTDALWNLEYDRVEDNSKDHVFGGYVGWWFGEFKNTQEGFILQTFSFWSIKKSRRGMFVWLRQKKVRTDW